MSLARILSSTLLPALSLALSHAACDSSIVNENLDSMSFKLALKLIDPSIGTPFDPSNNVDQVSLVHLLLSYSLSPLSELCHLMFVPLIAATWRSFAVLHSRSLPFFL